MAGQIFRDKFGVDPKKFGSIKEVNDFVEKKIGRKLKVKDWHWRKKK